MKILLANKFFYIKGGADNSFFQTAELLKKYGHEVIFFSMEHERNFPTAYKKYFISNVDYDKAGIENKIKSAFRLLYSFEAKKKIEQLIKVEKPDIIHLNSIYHQISPSILHVIRKYNIPVVMTLRDYKLVCASYLLFNGQRICEACKNGKYFQCALRKCVKNSRAKSLLNVIEMYLHHKIFHIYDLIDSFISPSKFLKDKIKNMGFKREIVHLPNFVQLEEFNPRLDWQENSIVYFGRLSNEKGLFTLIEAVKKINVKLKIIGEGPARESLELRVKNQELNNVKFLGYKNGEDLRNEIRKSMFAVLPSECYENNPRTIIEGFALGKPAIASRIGGIPELVKDNETGLTFKSADVEDLKSKLMQLLKNPVEIQRMGKNARAFVEKELNPEKHYEKLIKIYKQVIDSRSRNIN